MATNKDLTNRLKTFAISLLDEVEKDKDSASPDFSELSPSVTLTEKVKIIDSVSRVLLLLNKIDPDEEGESGFDQLRNELNGGALKRGADRAKAARG